MKVSCWRYRSKWMTVDFRSEISTADLIDKACSHIHLNNSLPASAFIISLISTHWVKAHTGHRHISFCGHSLGNITHKHGPKYDHFIRGTNKTNTDFPADWSTQECRIIRSTEQNQPTGNCCNGWMFSLVIIGFYYSQNYPTHKWNKEGLLVVRQKLLKPLITAESTTLSRSKLWSVWPWSSIVMINIFIKLQFHEKHFIHQKLCK